MVYNLVLILILFIVAISNFGNIDHQSFKLSVIDTVGQLKYFHSFNRNIFSTTILVITVKLFQAFSWQLQELQTLLQIKAGKVNFVSTIKMIHDFPSRLEVEITFRSKIYLCKNQVGGS